MAIIEVVVDGHPVLKKAAKRIRVVTDEICDLAENMIETMIKYNGVGLAANQVGEAIRLITVMHGEDDIRPYINPKIVKRSEELEYSDEGCLSFPLMFGTVGRSCSVEVHAQDLEMKKVKIEAEGFLARIFQHEIDHLNGITFVERVEKDTLRKYTPQELEDEEDGEYEETENESEESEDPGKKSY
ncbi:MAG TPA: peptide deformylase [bacterium]|mgnify:CR=1 FL=1|nr:peptide deformylase [bacterium]